MDYEIVLENEWATVRYEPTHKYIYHTFHKPIGGQPFRDALNIGLEAFITKGATKWLSDDRHNAELSPEDVAFGINDWGQRAAKAGWKYWALVVPESIAGRLTLSGIVEAYFNMGVRVAVFVDLEEAREWLIKM